MTIFLSFIYIMDFLLFLATFVLFFVLTPGVVLSLPPKGSKLVTALVHALLFAILLTLFMECFKTDDKEGMGRARGTDMERAYREVHRAGDEDYGFELDSGLVEQSQLKQRRGHRELRDNPFHDHRVRDDLPDNNNFAEKRPRRARVGGEISGGGDDWGKTREADVHSGDPYMTPATRKHGGYGIMS